MTRLVVECPLWTPYQRTPHQARFNARSKAYHASQNELALRIRMAAAASRIPLPVPSPYRVAICVFLPPVKGKRRGNGLEGLRLPANAGDWDNWLKAVLDAMCHHGMLAGDSAAHFRGTIGGLPCGVFEATEGQSPWGMIAVEECHEPYTDRVTAMNIETIRTAYATPF